MPNLNNLKIVVIGDEGVGKRTFIDQISGRVFKKDHLMDIGADFGLPERVIDGKKITFQIWILAPQDSFKEKRARFFRGSLGGLCVFDVTRNDSFMNVTRWIEELWRNGGRGIVPIILLGNKADLDEERRVTIDQIKNYATELTKKTKQYGFNVHFLDISAKTGMNVDLVLNIIGKQIIECTEKGTMKL